MSPTDVELHRGDPDELSSRNDPLEFAFGVKGADGAITKFSVTFAENGYVKIRTSDQVKITDYLVQWINGKWHRHKLSNNDGVVDTCPVHADGKHRHDTDAMTGKEMLLSRDPRVMASVLPPKKCACGQVRLPGIEGV